MIPRTSVQIAMATALAAMLLLPRLALCAAESSIVAPESLSFPNQVLGVFGSTSAPKHLKISIRKSSAGAVTIQGISVGGADSGDFTVKQPDDCIGASLKAGASCTVELTFTPTAMGKRTATLTVSDRSGDSRTVALSGRALKGILRLRPRDLSLGRVRIGASTSSTTVTLRNDNPVPLNISAINIAGRGFTASQNCVGELAGGGGSCRISVGVSPAAARRKGTPVSGMLEIADDAAGSPHKVKLSAIVVVADDPAPVPTATPTPAAVPADPLAAQILVTNSACDTVTSYAIGAAGNAAPIVAQAGLCNPTGIAVDSKANIYITNTGNHNEPSYSVAIYPPGASGSTLPSAIISGSSTGLVNPSAIAVDGSGNVYAANNGSSVGGVDTVTVYPAGNTGNAAPSTTIAGSNTRLNGPSSIAVDSSGNIYVANKGGSTVTVYAPGSTGNVAPSKTIGGYSTGLNALSSIAVDSSGKIYVTNEGSLDGGIDTVTVYPAGSSGNATPSAIISGYNTGLFEPVGIAADGSGKIYVANQQGYNEQEQEHNNASVTVYPTGSNGNVAPSATIDNSFFPTGIVAPIGIAVDSSGKIYVANGAGYDPNTGAFSAATVTVYPAGSNSAGMPPSATIGGSNTGLSYPVGIALDGSARIYVANDNNNTVTVYPAGSNGNAPPTATIGGSNTGLIYPVGIALDGSGNICVSNYNNAVTVYPPLGSSTGTLNESPTATIAGSNTGLSDPTGIALDGSGNIYVSNYNNTVTVYPPVGSSTGTLNESPTATIGGSSTGLDTSGGIALDGSANIYVTNFNTVTVYPPVGSSTGTLNESPTAAISGSNTRLSDALGIALDASGNIYVTEQFYNQYTENYTGAVTVYPAGSNGNVPPSAEIGGANSDLNTPFGIALDASRNIYVANEGYNPKIGSQGSVTVYPAGTNDMLAPSATIGGSGFGMGAPAGVALDSTGNIYVTSDSNASDFFEDAVTIYPAGSNASGVPIATITGGLRTPAGIAVDSSQTYTPPAQSVSVYADESFYGNDTGIFLNAGETVTFAASGSVYVGALSAPQYDNESPAGCPVATCQPYAGNLAFVAPGQPFWSLVGQMGGGTPFEIGTGATITAPTDGELYLSVNDSNFSDNSGFWNVTINLPPIGNIVYVANQGNDSVTVYADSVQLATISGSNTGLSAPTGIALDGFGNIYVTNEAANTVTVYPAESGGNVAPIATIAGSNTGLGYPSGVAIDGGGNVYVANKATDTVTIYSPGSNGNAAPSATIGGSNTGMDSPAGIAVDASGNIYVTNEGGFDGDNASVTVYPPGSNGNATPGVTIAGPATQLARPQGIAIVP